MTDIENNKKCRICIVGAGLTGTMMACLLGKLNYTVSVYEKGQDPRVVSQLHNNLYSLSHTRVGLTLAQRLLHGNDRLILHYRIAV